MKRFFEFYFTLGLHAGHSPQERMRVEMINQLSLIALGLILFYSLVLLLVGLPFLSFIIAATCPFYGSLPFLHRHQRSWLSPRFAFPLVSNLIIFIASLYLGRDSGAHLLLLPGACFALLFYRIEESLPIFCWSLLIPTGLLEILVLSSWGTAWGFISPFVINESVAHTLSGTVIPTAIGLCTFQMFRLFSHNAAFERELEGARRFLEDVINANPDPVLVKDRSHRWLLLNDAFCKAMGRSRASMIGRTDRDFFGPEIADIFWEKDELVFSTGEVNENEERFINGQGRHRTVLSKKSLLRTAEGELLLIASLRDITERVEAEDALRQERARVQGHAKMASLGEMAANIAHEINNPLAIIQLYSQQLQDLTKSLRTSTLPGHLDRIDRAALKIESTTGRIAKIVKGLRTLARDGSRDPMEPVRLQALVDEAVALCQSKLRSRDIQLEIRIPPEEMQVLCCPVQISQVLLNLISNSMDATEALAERWIRIEVTAQEDTLTLSVTDSGGGIPLEMRSKIMEPFFTTKGSTRGTGLGLSISLSILEAHGGSLRLDPDSPHTRFVVTLPKLSCPVEVGPL